MWKILMGAGLLVGLSACCTEMGCGPSMLMVSFSEPDLPDGEYQWIIGDASDSENCVFTLPIEDPPEVLNDGCLHERGDGEFLAIRRVGGTKKLWGLSFTLFGPEGAVREDERFTATWEKGFPNGNHCPAACITGRATLD